MVDFKIRFTRTQNILCGLAFNNVGKLSLLLVKIYISAINEVGLNELKIGRKGIDGSNSKNGGNHTDALNAKILRFGKRDWSDGKEGKGGK